MQFHLSNSYYLQPTILMKFLFQISADILIVVLLYTNIDGQRIATDIITIMIIYHFKLQFQ
ncbi:unnamed protein product [Paramecium pentaurelia]|uniref:Transmembrane protein n=1 Tax=Paramecium pentaurelia TaxID=43138 RepID=A0A8S1V1J0_9CILI|nr:unnamed protein product [Paramecium pentaurelia]